MRPCRPSSPLRLRRCAAVLAVALLAAACSAPTGAGGEADGEAAATLHTTHATLLRLEAEAGGVTLARVRSPWREGALLAQYLLVPRADTAWTPQREARARARWGADLQVVRTPLRRSALGASCLCYLLGELGAADCVAAVCDAAYTSLPEVRRRLADGRLRDAGSSALPNGEVLAEAACDAVWLSPLEQAMPSVRLAPGTALILCADYMETSPLARAEWMRFYGRLVGRAEAADSLFAAVAARYAALAADPTEPPRGARLLADLPMSSTWYVPGGRSTLGRLFRDAGFRYLWADDAHAGSLPLSVEAVLAEAAGSDVWIFRYYDPAKAAWSRADLLSHHPLLRRLGVVRRGRLYGCNTARSAFFDEVPFRPDLLLAELRRLAAPPCPCAGGPSGCGSSAASYFHPVL